MLVQDASPAESLCCVLEQDTLSAYPRKTENRLDMTEKLLTGT